MAEETVEQENKMGVMPIPKLLVSMSLPMIISMLVQALYNIVDSIFVAKYSQDALTAVSLAFPVQNLMIAVGAGTGVGINALLSRSLGEKNFDQANKAAKNGIFVTFLSAVFFMLFALFGSRLFFALQTGNQTIIDLGTQYLSIACGLSFGLFFELVFERLLQSTGKTFYTMISQGIGAIVNIILDPIMIFGKLGFPEMGVAGAALATILGQSVAAGLALYFNLRSNHEISISFRKFKPHGRTIGKIYAVGVPSIIMQSIGSVMTYGMNRILIGFSEAAVSVFGIYFKLQSFIFMPVFGINNGVIPIIAYNYGAKNHKRITKTIKLSIAVAMGMMFLGFAVFQVFPSQLLSLFDATKEMQQIGVPALRTISLSFIFAGYCIMLGSAFQAFGKGVLSLMVSIIRQLVVLLPCAFIFSRTAGLPAVWYAFPISEIFSLIFSTCGFVYLYKKIIKKLP